MEGLTVQAEKPSNTEVLGMLLESEKLPFITNLNMQNIKGLCKLSYFSKRLNEPTRNPIDIHNEVLSEYLALKCSMQTKKGNRADQVVDALKHIIDDENKDQLSSIADQIRK